MFIEQMSVEESMISLYSDTYKDAFGMRPRLNYEWFRGLDDAGQQKELDKLQSIIEASLEEDEVSAYYGALDLNATVDKHSGWARSPEGYWEKK